jgi:hypothetical protein
MEQRFWLLDQKANKAFETISPDDSQRTVEDYFGCKVSETGPMNYDFVSKGAENGYRYWNRLAD